jgi:hypothetical protein
MQMIRKLQTREGELLPFHQFDMDVGYGDGLDRVLLLWPLTISHVIDEDSPLYEIGKEELMVRKCAPVVTVVIEYGQIWLFAECSIRNHRHHRRW